MTSEQNPPDVQSHQAPPPPPQGSADFSNTGDAASKSRRRRRKRKNKAAAAVGAPPAVQSDAQPGSTPQAGAAPAFQQPQQGFQNNNNSGGKRWKKKFRRGGGSGSSSGSSYAGSNPSSSAPQFEKPGPGNSIYENNNRRRNKGGGGGGGGRQRGGFVGPMDHSYRATDGNFAESPRSTIEIHGNIGGGHRTHSRNHFSPDFMPSELLTNVRNVPIPEDAPTKIFFFVDDLFVTAKVNETARKLGVRVAFVKNDKEVFEQLTTSDDIPGLIVFDLNNLNAKPLTLIPKLKAKLKKTTSIIGYLSHLQGDLKAKATEAGCDTVMPKSAFSQNLPNLLRRYGIEDKDEPNFNQ